MELTQSAAVQSEWNDGKELSECQGSLIKDVHQPGWFPASTSAAAAAAADRGWVAPKVFCFYYIPKETQLKCN